MSASTSLIRSVRIPVCRPRRLLSLALTSVVRNLATIHSRNEILHDSWFYGYPPLYVPVPQLGDVGDPRKSPDPRTLKLGKTLRILQERLPTLLQSPLPQEILSPQIKLRLFPSTHSHLPTVSGRVAYMAALWSFPIAWGRIPLVGNVKLEILSERMIKNPPTSPCSGYEYTPEQFIVRWRTCDKSKNQGLEEPRQGPNHSSPAEKITGFLGGRRGEEDRRKFTGLFIFEFDEEGRIAAHTIEHLERGRNWESGVGARVVGLTDWLLGGLKGRSEGVPGVPVCISRS